MLRTTLALSALAVALTAACGHDAPGTSVGVSLAYDDGLQLEIADVTLTNRTESGPIAHQLLLLVPDDLAGTEMPIEVWARRAGKRTAYGATSAVPLLGKTVQAQLSLTACTPGCSGAMLTTCTGPVKACTLGCSDVGDAHCIGPRPSNGVDPAAVAGLSGTTTITGDTTFDTGTGEITGALSRAPGTGIDAGIGYVQSAGVGGGAPLGIFVFHNLTVEVAALVRFTGPRAVVFLVGDTAKIDGQLEPSAGQGMPSNPGPGGGAGGTAGAPAGGCGPGGAGSRGAAVGSVDDSGGGGGGGGAAGGAGGVSRTTNGGAAGIACLPATLEPLQGGSGGGRSSPGATAGARGGGGGGALQLTALGSLEINGIIHAGGAGGESGLLDPLDASSGGGGGGGGAILLEAPSVVIGGSALVAANGGGGGGGGGTGALANGGNATPSLTPAVGAAGFSVGTSGGAGDVAGRAAVSGSGSSGTLGAANGGGGGGAVGAIVIRGRAVTLNGLITPTASKLDVQIGQ